MEQKLPASGEAGLSNEAILDLIREIAGGRQPALIALYDSTSRLTFGLIVRILGNRPSADEALLDAYTSVWKQSTLYDPGISPMEWLMKIARDCAAARLLGVRRDNRNPEIAADHVNSETSVASGQQKLARYSLEAIPSAQRELLEWAYYGSVSCGEMAAQIGKPIGAVKTLLRLGLSGFGESFNRVQALTDTAETGGQLEARESD